MKVIVPEEGLARLSRRLLAPLGLGKVSVETLDAWAYATARAAFGVQGHQAVGGHARRSSSRLKRHPALRRALRGPPRRAQDARRSRLQRLRKRLAEALHRPALPGGGGRRLRRGPAAHGHRGDGAAHDAAARHAARAGARGHTTRSALSTVDGKSLDEDTPDELAGTLDLDDLPHPAVPQGAAAGAWRSSGWRTWCWTRRRTSPSSSCSCWASCWARTAAARSRATRCSRRTTSFAGWPAVLAELGVPDAAHVPAPGLLPLPAARRGAGAPGARRRWRPRGAAARARGRAGGLPPLPGRGPGVALPRRRAAATCWSASRAPRWPSSPAAREAARGLPPRGARTCPGRGWCWTGDFTFEPGVDVTDVDSVKGLEFDYVILPDATARAYPPRTRRAAGCTSPSPAPRTSCGSSPRASARPCSPGPERAEIGETES